MKCGVGQHKLKVYGTNGRYIIRNGITSFGFGLGYQWRIGPAFVLRTEAQYRRMFVEDENVNEYTLTIGIGTRFGNSKSNISEVSSMQ